MALKIVRAAGEQAAVTPLRHWYAGRREDAFAALAAPDGGAQATEAATLVELALVDDPAHAAAIGRALAAWDDDVAAYRLLRSACERLLDQASPQGAARWAPLGVAIAELVLPYLEAKPWEPVLLNYLGVALYGSNDPKLAVEVLRAAERLDPAVENLQGNLGAARTRAARPINLPLPPGARARLKAVEGRLRVVARRTAALPAPGRISFCMIVRDEEEMLPDCLASVRDGVDELIVVDTGSTDRTVEIAESFGATVLHVPWTGDFSGPRNAGFDAATGDWILWLDADERLEEGDAERLHELTRKVWREAFWLTETNFTGQDEVGTAATHLALRLLRNRPAYRFTGTIHEQLRSQMPIDLAERFAFCDLRIRHYGYLKARIEERDKNRRNLQLLERELAGDPRNPFTLFNIGTEYVSLGDHDRARDHLERSYAELSQKPSWWEFAFAPLLAIRLVGVRRATGDLERAASLAKELEEVFPGFTDLTYERGLAARDGNRLAEARALFERCLEQGDAPARYAGTVGHGSFLALAALADIASHDDIEAAADYLQRSLDEHPDYLPAGLYLATTLLAQPDADPDAVLARLEGRGVDKLTWWLFLGTAFYERGHAGIAEGLFRRALERGEQHGAARVGLVEALLSQRRYAEVEAAAGDLPVGTLPFAAVQRSRVLAGALVGDREAVEDAVARLSSDPAETGFLRAFGAAVAGDDEPLPLQPGAAPHVVRMLDGLARLEEFDAFERVVPLLERSIGHQHEATLVLGELYLQRGFYRLAGDAALRAIELAGPDARSLALLGKAAVAEGMFDDALPILEEALALDPTQSSVRYLIERVRTREAA